MERERREKEDKIWFCLLGQTLGENSLKRNKQENINLKNKKTKITQIQENMNNAYMYITEYV